MSNNWKFVWENKKSANIDIAKNEFDIFCDLKKADGFDVNVYDEQSYFKAFYNDWLEMYKTLHELASNNIQSVYEVGCGSGVNLYLFQNRIKNVILGGIDYSQNLIDTAKSIISSKDLTCGNAQNMDVNLKYDIVMADSVFQYFESHEYAETILNKMIIKSKKAVYISEIHDINLREEWIEYRRNSMKNYDLIYEGLDKLFYSREWFLEIVHKNGKRAIFTQNNNSEYWNSKYIFNCYIF